MQYGFLIYSRRSVFILKKTSVPDDKDPFIDNIWDVKRFDTFEEALVFAERKIVDIRGPQWRFEVVVARKGLGPTIQDLGISDFMLQEEAEALCKEKAQSHVEDNYKPEDLKEWTHTIFPILR